MGFLLLPLRIAQFVSSVIVLVLSVYGTLSMTTSLPHHTETDLLNSRPLVQYRYLDCLSSPDQLLDLCSCFLPTFYYLP